MHYLITGHTGFKGSWLALMLEMQGHTVSGIALDPPNKSLFNQAYLSSIFENDIRLDIRDASNLKSAIENIDPEVIIHLAAQPLVRESYRFPVETFHINVLGTLNVLDATKNLKNLKAALIITTDKVYKNHNYLRGYVETDELGGDDPYSASKAAADIVAQSWIKNFAQVPFAIARAGNVIGGGDWAEDRIVPDIVDSYTKGSLPAIRYPNAIRPWQHVLDCISGYISLINSSIENGVGGEWNFGPDLKDKYSVSDLISEFAKSYKISGSQYELDDSTKPQESGYLLLDSSKARSELDWAEKLNFEQSVSWTADWYQRSSSEDVRKLTNLQIEKFLEL
jgi:CDP-glucose 4,6-dehydratase